MDGKKLIYADDFISSLRDDPLINGANFKRVVQHINDAPAVDTVVHWEWLDGCAVCNGIKVYDSIDCSHCEGVFKIESETREYWKNRFKVCPFCGAKMDGGNEDG